MKRRILTSLFIISAVIPPLVFGGVLLDLLMVVVALMAMYEILKIRTNKIDLSLYLATLFYILLMIFFDENYSMVYTMLLLIIICFISIISPKYQFDDVSLIFIMSLIVATAVETIIHIYTISGFIMIYIVILNYATDAGAYFIGYCFGKHKLNVRISPNKTIEGSIGGFLISVLFSIGLCYFVPEIQMNLSLAMIVALTIGIPIISQIGDLTFSLIKRHYNVKDFGSIFPGHGGMLDRVDSLLFSLIYFMIIWMILL